MGNFSSGGIGRSARHPTQNRRSGSNQVRPELQLAFDLTRDETLRELIAEGVEYVREALLELEEHFGTARGGRHARDIHHSRFRPELRTSHFLNGDYQGDRHTEPVHDISASRYGRRDEDDGTIPRNHKWRQDPGRIPEQRPHPHGRHRSGNGRPDEVAGQTRPQPSDDWGRGLRSQRRRSFLGNREAPSRFQPPGQMSGSWDLHQQPPTSSFETRNLGGHPPRREWPPGGRERRVSFNSGSSGSKSSKPPWPSGHDGGDGHAASNSSAYRAQGRDSAGQQHWNEPQHPVGVTMEQAPPDTTRATPLPNFQQPGGPAEPGHPGAAFRRPFGDEHEPFHSGNDRSRATERRVRRPLPRNMHKNRPIMSGGLPPRRGMS